MAEYLTAKEISEITGKTKRGIMSRANSESWPYIEESCRGGLVRRYAISTLPSEIQTDLVQKQSAPVQTLPALAPEAALKALDQVVPVTSFMEAISQSVKKEETWTAETAISEADLQNPRIRRILKILREAENIPRNWIQGKRKWIETVALRNDTDYRSIYRWMKKYEKQGIAGIRHSKSTAGKPKTWTPEAIELWIGLCLKREHRKIDRKDLYRDCLIPECLKRGWNYGCYESANWWYERRVNPQLLALQKGGMRALDNMLPPVLRDYSDLQPFEILVGDQHRFDRWVVDEETGEVFRPEAYLWQDLRTRAIYGAAVDKKYDSWLIGLALRIGIKCFGAFGSVYTDNGRPECSRYLMEILGNIRALGMEWQRTEESFMDVVDADPEDVNPHVIMPGTHKKAIVKNAKAKMIEGTFHILDTHIMTSHFRMPGAVKNLKEDIHWQDVDQLEAQVLAKAGKLLTAREHALLMYLAIDYYNREKAHRGVLKEWAWKARPSAATPLDCLKACYDEGWRPKMISDEAADLLFLAKDSRIIHLGRITFDGEQYEHDKLLSLHKERVDIRYNPMNTQELHVFDRGRYLCTAVPVEYSSMKDMDLAARKIEEKRSRRKLFSEEFKKVTSMAPNFIEYSRVPQAEKVAALIGEDRKRRALEQKEISKQLTPEQLEAEVTKLEETGSLPRKTCKPLPTRPGYFKDDQARYEWCARYIAAGGTLTEEDAAWKKQRESQMDPGQIEYWNTFIEYGN